MIFVLVFIVKDRITYLYRCRSLRHVRVRIRFYWGLPEGISYRKVLRRSGERRGTRQFVFLHIRKNRMITRLQIYELKHGSR